MARFCPRPANLPVRRHRRGARKHSGWRLRGGFHPGPQDGVPALPRWPAGRDPAAPPGTIGSRLVGRFRDRARGRPMACPIHSDPLEPAGPARRSRRSGTGAGGTLFPFGGPPYLPFQRWGPARPEPVSPVAARHADFTRRSACGTPWRGALALRRARLALAPGRAGGPAPATAVLRKAVPHRPARSAPSHRVGL